MAFVRRTGLVSCLLLCAACASPSREELLDGKPCDAQGECASGYRCNLQTQLCARSADAADCGDGTLQPGEACDPAQTGGLACTEDCQLDCAAIDALSVSATLSDGFVHCYRKLGSAADFETSQAACEDRGAYLATVLDSQEMQVVSGFATFGTYSWIGATDGLALDDVRVGDWQWVTGEPWGYVPGLGFTPGTDGCPGGVCSHCATLIAYAGGAWDDRPCDADYLPICEWGPVVSSR